jgi:hypothetical protein
MTTNQGMTTVLMYSMMRDPEFIAAAQRVQAGTAVGTDLAVIQKTNTALALPPSQTVPSVPATKFAGLTKAAGAAGSVGAALSTYSLGTLVGNGAVGLLGIDSQGTVCGNTGSDLWGSLARFGAGVDCSSFDSYAAGFTANLDASTAQTSGKYCDSAGRCAQLAAIVGPWRFQGTADTSATGYSLCWTVSGAATVDTQQFFWMVKPGATSAASGWQTYGVGLTNSANQTYPGYTACKGIGSGVGTPQRVYDRGVSEAAPYFDMATHSIRDGWVIGAAPSCTSTICTARGDMVPIVGTRTDPDRTLRCTIAGTDGNSYTAVTAPFKESAGVLPTPSCGDLPSGVGIASTTITEEGGPAPKELYNQPTTPEYQAAQQLAPECATKLCTLELRKGTQSCQSLGADCADWFTDADKASKYSCVYGTHAVSLSECNAYAPTYKPTNLLKGTVLGDPTTGAELAQPADDAGTGTGGSSGPSPADSCWSNGWASVANPLDWVLVPVKCALTWAFVPSQASVTNFVGNSGKVIENSGAGIAVAAVGVWATQLQTYDGCQGPPFQINAFGLNVVGFPMSACEEPLASIAAVIKGMGGATVYIVSFLAIVRYLVATFGYIGYGRLDAFPEPDSGPTFREKA